MACSRSSDFCQWPARSSVSSSIVPSRVARHFLDRQRVERSREVGGKAHRFRRPLPAPPHDRRQCQLPGERVDRARDGIGTIGRIERAADAVVEIGIADRNQPRQHEPIAADARTNASVSARTARLLGNRIRPPASAIGVPPVARDQAGGERVGEAAMRRDGENGRP